MLYLALLFLRVEYIMKLTKGRISKLLKEKNQSMKNHKNVKHNDRTNTFRKRRPLDLNNRTLKNIFMVGGDPTKSNFNIDFSTDTVIYTADGKDPVTKTLIIDYTVLPYTDVTDNTDTRKDIDIDTESSSDTSSTRGKSGIGKLFKGLKGMFNKPAGDNVIDNVIDKNKGLERGDVLQKYNPTKITPRKIKFGKEPVKIDIDAKPLSEVTAALETYLTILIAKKLRELIPSGPQNGISSSDEFLKKLENSLKNAPTIDVDILNKLGLQFNVGSTPVEVEAHVEE